MREFIIQLLLQSAMHLDKKYTTKNPEPMTTEIADYNSATNSVKSILSYIDQDAAKYQDLTAASMEYELLNVPEREIAFFWLLGQYMDLRKGGSGHTAII